ncbi:hypothetical protein AX17_006124 [Amanita inopinata Kibby_2008]|nr:hypothetical protein AX17_006124 [Amanita inopinata Kibby_2008]
MEEDHFVDIVFNVEDELFKAPKHLFIEQSEIFRNMFDTPVPEGAPLPDGSTDARPLVLEGVRSVDFMLLLVCLYPPGIDGKAPEMTLEQWQAVLSLATRYEMTRVKALALEHMTPLLVDLPALQVHLAKKYRADVWLVPGFNKLAQRAETLSEEEVELIGLPDALKLMALREQVRRSCRSCGRDSYNCRYCHNSSFTQIPNGSVTRDLSAEVRRHFALL